MPTALDDTAAALLTFAMSLPGATEDFPWGERVVKVNKKVFVFLGKVEDTSGGFGLSVKLPTSGERTLELPFATPTGYGLGKSGWVSLKFAPVDHPDLAALRAWVEESYRAIAPKKLVKTLDAGR
ncbi:MAG: MmcQ/YjbR family DNA-binding protein [Pseudomonadota bacterium]|nr:MmcQ/YjbR family DNA-binding protein [Pseudomonadota bacterium]